MMSLCSSNYSNIGDETTMKICTQCVLPETFPGIKFNAHDICQYCQGFKGVEHLEKQKEQYRLKFKSLLSARDSSPGAYDVLVAYSGGKDSTFILELLKKQYGLNVLALTFDHGFVSPYALENIRRVVEILGVDQITFKPDFQLIQRMFRYSLEHEFHPPKALERASSVCNTCMGMVKFIILQTAIEKEIPFIAYGWSPGQAPIQSAIMKNQPSFVRKFQDLFLHPLEEAVGPEVRAYFLEERHFKQGANANFPCNINPLAFLRYDEEEIYKQIRALGWQPPRDTDPNSTNCLLNSLANQVHLERHHYHPYAMEMAELVRNGMLSREEALRRLSEPADPQIIEQVKGKLGLKP
ncbi:MAG: 7-cyano-7-deazaguanine synthase [Desulfobacteraceae bacterium]|nr:7-cyano-7-deazaguanine synthase [Desulfobacteraceae bacterium]